MKAGDVFTLDTQAIQEVSDFTKVPLSEVQKKLSVGDTFSVAKSDTGKGEVARASRWVDGKPKKGRPRRFPRNTIARLLGEEVAVEAEETTVDDDAALEERAAELLATSEQSPTDSW